jgi:uncharacterized repeat protein (TIGR03803 family)
MNSAIRRRICLCVALVLAPSVLSSAQTYTVIATLTGNNANPQGALIQGVNGDFYGTSYGYVGNDEYGSVFKVSTTGTVTTLYTFCKKTNCTDGSYPTAGLLLAKNLDFYGTTTSGGKYGDGTVFKLTPSGELTTLYSFCKETNCADGVDPVGGLIQASNGLLYGTTAGGGTYGQGTVFSITTGGTLTTLYSFCEQFDVCADGGAEPESNLVQASNGNLYGTTTWGSIFEITPQGALTILYEFCSQPSCEDGNDPLGNIAQSADGVLYGATSKGGAYSGGVEWEFDPSSSFYEWLYFFGSSSGAVPNSATVGSDGNVYGTSLGAKGLSGIFYPSTAFEINTTSFEFTLLYTFCQDGTCSDGGPPTGGMVQSTNGNFYGASGGGTVFSLSTGLGPFVMTTPTSGEVGSTVYILGTDLTGSTAVTFNGVAAKFTVESSSEIKATVPKGAKSGAIQVTTPSSTLTSNNVFTVS